MAGTILIGLFSTKSFLPVSLRVDFQWDSILQRRVGPSRTGEELPWVIRPPHARPSPPALDGLARGQRPAQRDEVPPQTSGRGTGATFVHRRGI